MTVVLAASTLAALAILLLHVALILGSLLSIVAERHFVAIEAEIEAGRVSVIVPARDDQDGLPRLLSCLERQNTNRFEIVLVNDRSEDRTEEIMREFSSRHRGRVRVVTLEEDPGAADSRQQALAAGVAAATGDLLLITDANSWVPVDWVRTMCRPFKSHDAGLVFGPVMPGREASRRRRGFLDLFQGFDQLLRYEYTSGLAGLGFPLGSFGSNIAVRRQALSDVGGFEELRFTQSVGVPLTGKIRETGRWAIRAIRSRGARVFSTPERSLSGLILRRIRWSSGGLVARDVTTRRTYASVV
ncbi:MAG: glycosyltransferase, partial [bacterium]